MAHLTNLIGCRKCILMDKRNSEYDVERNGWVNDSYPIDYQSPTWQFIVKNRHLVKGKILDVGCSGGYHLYSTVELFGTEGVGVDINPKQIEYAEKLRRPIDKNVRFDVCNVLDINTLYNNGYFDTIMMFHTMEHFPRKDLDVIMNNLKRLLKPNGSFLILVPYEHAHDSVGHNTYWDEQKLQWFMEHIVEMKTVYCEKIVNEQLVGVWLNEK